MNCLKKEKVGLIGYGFVGSALATVFRQKFNVLVYDINQKLCTATFQELLQLQSIFICVPTPSKPDGICDISIVQSVLDQLKGFRGIVVVKSTLFCSDLNLNNLRVVYNPEFLTEKNAVQDFKNAKRILLGGKIKDTNIIKKLYLKLGYSKKIIFQNENLDAFALVKYMSNCFLASKVAIFNEYFNMCQSLQLDYNTIKELIVLDPRIGSSHTNVPNGQQFGFSGHCFPKDTKALLNKFPNAKILESIIKENETQINKKF